MGTPHDLSDKTDVDPSLGRLVSLVQRFGLEVTDGPSKGITFDSAGRSATVGSDPGNDLVLEDRMVSRFHCELLVDDSGVRIHDLGSRNGTFVDGMRVVEAWLREGSNLRLGQTALRFRLGSDKNALPQSPNESFGTLLGRSGPMRAAFTLLERAAATDSTVLLEGETGTGKEEAAISIHEASPRAGGPFVVIDCSAIHANLLESELFGHERGAFTGAVSRRIGAFEAANGGTIFLDEIGELPSDLQPKLLRVLERRTIRRLGGNAQQAIDVRVIAATHRDLRREVNDGRFRSDLYYRLAVVRVRLPPLRERPGDIPLLVQHIVRSLAADESHARAFEDPELLGRLRAAAWPGNVRQLRNYVEQCLVLQQPAPLGEVEVASAAPVVDSRLSYAEARRRALDVFERAYVASLMERHQGRVADAARAAQMHRVYLHKLLTRHGLRT